MWKGNQQLHRNNNDPTVASSYPVNPVNPVQFNIQLNRRGLRPAEVAGGQAETVERAHRVRDAVAKDAVDLLRIVRVDHRRQGRHHPGAVIVDALVRAVAADARGADLGATGGTQPARVAIPQQSSPCSSRHVSSSGMISHVR